MKIWNFGSINTDIVYDVKHIVTATETLAASARNTFPGGKGLNQSVAISRAGSTVFHVGRIGPEPEGNELKNFLGESGVDTSLVEVRNIPTGHAIIQVDRRGENAIVLFPGANKTFLTTEISSILSNDKVTEGDWVLLQNETNCVNEIITEAAQKGLKVAFNFAPAEKDPEKIDALKKLDLLFVNEGELQTITGTASVESGLAELRSSCPNTRVVVTLGADGSIYQFQEERIEIPAEDVEVSNTTGAGDTFVGYFLAEFASTGDADSALRFATCAAAISVTRSGAADSIPFRSEVLWCLVTKGLSSDLKQQACEHLGRYFQAEQDVMDYEQLLSVVTEFMSQYPDWSWNDQQWCQ
jgi:ribokinase